MELVNFEVSTLCVVLSYCKFLTIEVGLEVIEANLEVNFEVIEDR